MSAKRPIMSRKPSVYSCKSDLQTRRRRNNKSSGVEDSSSQSSGDSKPSVHSCKSDLKTRRRRSKTSRGEEEQSNNVGGKLEDMPVKVLEEIFRGYGPFTNLEQVGEFGENFGKASGKLLHAAYLQFESDLLHDIAATRKRLADTLSDGDNNKKDKSVVKKTTLCKSILQLETLSSTFAHVKATIWSYTSAGICSRYDGQLLDHLHRARKSIMAAATREPTTKPAADRVVGKCRASAATFIWNFLLEVEEKPLTEEERKRVDILGAITLLNTLACAKDSCVTASVMTRYTGVGSDRTKMATLTVDFSLPFCWMGFFASLEYTKHSAEVRVIDAMHVLRQLVWVSNSEYHLHEWQNSMKLLDVPQPKVPKSMSVLLGEGLYRNDGKTGRWFDCIDSDGERVFYFGLHSRARYRPSTTLPHKQSSEERIRLVDRVVTIPKDFSDAVLDVKLEITCDESLLPEMLCRQASGDERTLPAGLTPSFVLRIASYEDGARAKCRVCDFACYSTGRRRREERLVIGDHGWRMMEVGDSVDKHRIYETQGKIALAKSSPNLYKL